MAIFEKVSRVDVRFRGFPHLYINRGHFSEDREAGQSSTEEGHSWIKRDPDAPDSMQWTLKICNRFGGLGPCVVPVVIEANRRETVPKIYSLVLLC